jgi:protein ImuB
VLWLCLYLANLPVELRGTEENTPLAVTDRYRSRRIIIAANRSARTRGVATGQDATSALAHEPALRLIERTPAHETRALKALAAWAIQFSTDVRVDHTRWLLWIEVGGSLEYFEGLENLLQRVGEGLTALGYSAQRGVAPTLEAAALLSRDPDSKPVLALDALRDALDAQPIARLALPWEVLSHLKASGLQTVGEVCTLPAAALSRRFGPEAPKYLRQLLGERADLRPRFKLPDRYRRQFECGYPVASVEGLLFPFRRLLQELQGFLRGRDCSIQRLLITLEHRDAPDTVLELRTTSPQREAMRLFALLRERLERVTLPEPVTDIRLSADELLPPDVAQNDFFDDSTKLDAGWVALLDKLRARLGTEAIRQLGLADDHRPEKAWVSEASKDDRLPDAFPQRPLWILDPVPIEELPTLCGTPERIEAGWWTGTDASRDYYLARTPEGARWWLYKDIRTQRWYLQGLWG